MLQFLRGHVGQSLLPTTALSLLLGACSAERTTAGPAGSTPDAVARTPSERPAARPGQTAGRVAIPPGVEPERLRPHGSDDVKAPMELDAALARLAPDDVLPPQRSVAPPTEEVLRETTHLYLQAREMAIEARYFDSIRSLEQALKLDPGAIACMRLMADNYLSTIGPARALRLYEDILALQPDDLESLLRLGSAAWQRRDVPRAAGLLGRAYALRNEDGVGVGDPTIWYLIAHELGHVLLSEGYDQAGVAVWHELLERLPEFPPESTRFQREIDRLYRVIPEVWRDLGDAYCRLERYDDAVEVYARAQAAARVSDEDMLPRLVWALAQSGRESQAINVLLDAIDNPQQAGAIELVALFRDTAASEPLAAALRERLSRDPGELRYVQAIAGLLPPDRSDAIILEFLGEHGAESRVLQDLLPWAVERLKPVQPVRLIVTLAQQNGLVPDKLLDELVALTDDPARFIDAWDELPAAMKREPEARMVRAGLLLRQMRFESALETIETLLADQPDSTAALLLKSGVLFSLNLTDAAAETAAQITHHKGEPIELAYAHARMLAQLKQVDAALAQLDALQANPPDGFELVEHLRRKATLLISAGRHNEAATLLDEALAKDAKDPATYGAMLRLYGLGGPLQDGSRFGDLVRALYATAPESRTFRLLRAEQDAGRGRFDDAIAGYQALLAEDITDQAAIDGLLRTWIAAGRASEAAGWFESRRAARPGDRQLRQAMYQALIADQRSGEVIERLRAAIARQPKHFDAYRLLETALKSVGREEEARQVTRDRWNQMPPSVAQSLALASLEIEQGAGEQALSHLRDAVQRAEEHLDRHIQDITLLASRIDAAGLRHEALQLITEIGRRVIANHIEAQPPVFIAYVNAVAELNSPLEEIIAAIDEVRDLQPTIELELIGVATITLARHERIDDAVALCDHWFGEDRPVSDREAGLLQWRLAQTALRDEPQRAINLIRRAHESDAYKAIGFLTARPMAGEQQFAPLAESLYRMSGEFSAQGHDESHNLLLEEALRVDPSHPMANNDLGYSLADRNERLEEAEAMLITAIKAAPADSAVLDSLGWVRYKLGKLENPDDEPREVHEDAAIPLLEEAALLRKRDSRRVIEDDPVILDHLGDAYWRAGRVDDAINVWERAVDAYDQQLEMTLAAVEDEDGEAAVEVFKRYYGAIVDAARAKAAAAKAGERPAVAPSPALDKNQP